MLSVSKIFGGQKSILRLFSKPSITLRLLCTEKSETSIQVRLLPVEQRLSFIANRTVNLKDQGSGVNRCKSCWQHISACHCAKMNKISDWKHNLIVFIHYEEYMNSVSTTSTLCLSLPNTKVFVIGIEEHEKEFRQLLTERSKETIILFPSTDALFMDQLKAYHASLIKQNEHKQDLQKPLQLVILDGTWGNAKTLHRRIRTWPESDPIPDVRLFPSDRSIFVRKQTQDDRVSSLEAVARFAVEYESNERLSQQLIENLQIHTQTLRPKPSKHNNINKSL